MRDLSRRMNDVNNDVQVLVSRYQQAVQILDAWASEHPDSQIAGHTRNVLDHWAATDGATP